MRSTSKAAILVTIGLTLALTFVGAARAFQVEMELPVLGGGENSLEQHRGKWVVVNYWATWCPPCLEEIPELVAFHDAHKAQDAVVWGVNFEDISPRALEGFLEEFVVTYPVSTVPPAGNTPLGPVTGLPTTFLVDPEGRLVTKHTGPVNAEMLERLIQAGASR
jgi:thiol-disulfide isomerase/thioredoxin